MAAHFITSWTELAAAVAAAAEGDWIVIESDELVATSNIVVAKSLQFCNGPGIDVVNLDYSTGYRLLWQGAGGVLKTIKWHDRVIVDCGDDDTADAWKCESAAGPLTFEGHRITIKSLGGNLRCFHGIKSSEVNNYAWTMNLYSCIAYNIGQSGGGGDYSDGFSGHWWNAGGEVLGVMNLYGCSSWDTRDQSLTTHDGCTLNVFGGRFENVFCVGDGSTFYAEDATFDCPATQIYDRDPVTRDQALNAGLTHTFIRCKFTQRATLTAPSFAETAFILCSQTMTFIDCEFTYAASEITGHMARVNHANAILTLRRCKFDVSQATTIASSKALVSVSEGECYIEGCTMIGPSPATGSGTWWFAVFASGSEGTFIHNTLDGRRDLVAGNIVGIWQLDADVEIRGNIIAHCDTGITVAGTLYTGGASNGLNLFYGNTADTTAGTHCATDIWGSDPKFDWGRTGTLTWAGLHIAQDSPAANLDPEPSYQIPSFGFTVLGALGAEPETLAWDAQEPASAEAKIDLGCYTNRWTTKRTVTQEVTLNRRRYVTVALAAPAALGGAAPVL